jgi:hypothetical protein
MKKIAPTPLFNKLNLGAHDEIVLLNAPASFEAELKQLKGVKIVRDPGKPKAIKFGLAFAVTQVQLDRASKLLASGSEGDAVLWFAYPKGTSKRYTCEFNRVPAGASFEPPASTPCAWWRSTRIGLPCAFGVWSTSRARTVRDDANRNLD